MWHNQKPGAIHHGNSRDVNGEECGVEYLEGLGQ